MAQSSPQGPPTFGTSLGTCCRGTAWGHPAGKGLIIPHPGMGSFHLVWVWRKNSFGSARPHPKITRPPMVITELPLLGSLLPFQLLPAGPGRTACLGCWEPWGSPPTLRVTAPFPVSPLDKKNQVSVASPRLGMAAVPGTALLEWSKGTQTPWPLLPLPCGHTGDTQHNSPPTHGQSVTPFGSSCHDIARPCAAASPPCSAADPFSF